MFKKNVRCLVLLFCLLVPVLDGPAEAASSCAELALKYGVAVPENNVENVGFEIKVTPGVARPGQPVKVTFVIRNLSGKVMILPWRHIYARCFSYRVVGEKGLVFCDPEYGLAPGASGVVKLEAGQSYSESIVWDQQKFLGPSDFGRSPEGQVAPGEYLIAASFNLERKKKGNSLRSGNTNISVPGRKEEGIGGLSGISIVP